MNLINFSSGLKIVLWSFLGLVPTVLCPCWLETNWTTDFQSSPVVIEISTKVLAAAQLVITCCNFCLFFHLFSQKSSDIGPAQPGCVVAPLPELIETSPGKYIISLVQTCIVPFIDICDVCVHKLKWVKAIMGCRQNVLRSLCYDCGFFCFVFLFCVFFSVIIKNWGGLDGLEKDGSCQPNNP